MIIQRDWASPQHLPGPPATHPCAYARHRRRLPCRPLLLEAAETWARHREASLSAAGAGWIGGALITMPGMRGSAQRRCSRPTWRVPCCGRVACSASQHGSGVQAHSSWAIRQAPAPLRLRHRPSAPRPLGQPQARPLLEPAGERVGGMSSMLAGFQPAPLVAHSLPRRHERRLLPASQTLRCMRTLRPAAIQRQQQHDPRHQQ